MALEIVFWVAVGLIVYAHLGYPLLLRALVALFGERDDARAGDTATREMAKPADAFPHVSLIIPAHDEEEVIERKVANARGLDYPADRLEVIVVSDGSSDRTVELARSAGADQVLDLPRGGKVAALNQAVRAATGEILAFSDANSYWRPDALRRLVDRFADERVGYACGQVRFEGGGGGNQEGLYWRYEMAVRSMETRLAGITAGNGGIYAVRREAYIELDPSRGQDIGFPFELTKRGWRAVYEPAAAAEEKMAPTVEGEFRRKRRMMLGLWDVMLKWGMLDPRGYGPAYALEIYSHRLLRYLTPWLHLIAFAVNIPLLSHGWVYVVTMALQLGLLVAAALGRFVPALPFRIAYYYVTVTASIAVGLWDRLRAGGVPIGWEKVEGTR
ncbi:MAG TPA: glycosyltransferase family 2 protein [Solirubrobacterales bacterium]|jgi:cellulose synthase/poly-beta-1,6-N-acetylglucosamine synthase-like glycosyltransferase|nr:glycosyltransferase family 2 protein [Solirubrobacterales bacterium]